MAQKDVSVFYVSVFQPGSVLEHVYMSEQFSSMYYSYAIPIIGNI